ncbi:unnamed protein product, partial [Brassica rapa subsp. trilocularis]
MSQYIDITLSIFPKHFRFNINHYFLILTNFHITLGLGSFHLKLLQAYSNRRYI